MEPRSTDENPHEHPRHLEPDHAGHHAPAHPPHHLEPIDPGYRLIVHITLWVIAGTLLVALCIWWAMT
jgi:hypothetical protein